MMKKILALVLVLALALGTLAVTASAATTGDKYEVGYAKVDINPYWHEWVNWSKTQTITNENQGAVGDPIPGAGKIPSFTDFTYDAYDMMPLPMGGYGNNITRLSRPKLMDDNGSGEGASSTKLEYSSSGTKYYYQKSDGTYAQILSTSTFNSRTAIYTRSGNKYTKVAAYQDVHLDNNRYTEKYAKAYLGEEGAADYYATAGSWGENDGDGVWATCVLVKDPQSSSPLLMITVDNISVDASIIGVIKAAILEKEEVQKLGLTRDRILITANHTHGSVALTTGYDYRETDPTYKIAENTFKNDPEANASFSEQQLYWYMSFYKSYLQNQLVNAAVTAIGDLEVAQTKTMEKGSIDVSDQTNYQLNGVRHRVQTYDGSAFEHGEEITYVRGSSFNNHMDDTDGETGYDPSNEDGFSGSRPVTDSDDSMHILRFTFENKEPIAMVNFRAHSTANNKETAKLLHYNISADWVSPLRYELEQAGYRFSLLYGNSGNLGTGATNAKSAIPQDYANYNTETGKWELPATPYGRLLAQAAKALLGEVAEANNSIISPMNEVTMGKIRTLQTHYSVVKQQWNKLQYAAALQFYADGLKSEGGESYTFKDGETVSYTTSAGKTYSVTLGEGEGGTYVIASDYHAKAVKRNYESSAFVSIELNAIHLGDEVAFVTTPVEASDRYISDYTGSTSNIPEGITNNDWNKLNDATWGTPFMLSLTNGANGYVPNQLAYDYNNDCKSENYQVAVGSYESHTAYADRGQGENIVATLNTMLRDAEPREAYCEGCKATKTWLPYSSAYFTNGKLSTSGHYYLLTDYGCSQQSTVATGVTLCLDLNGHTYSAEVSGAASRAYIVQGTLNVQDSSQEKSGKLQGLGVQWKTHTGFSAGTLSISSGGTVNLYSGSLTMNHVDKAGPVHGGVITVNGTFNMHGGNVYGGIADNGLREEAEIVKQNGGNIYVNGGKFNMYGGKVYDGKAVYAGGNIFVSSGTANLTGGTVEGGEAQLGGGIYANGGTLNLNGVTVTGGKATDGGSLYVKGGTVKLLSGAVDGGEATNGGSVYLAKAATLTGGTIRGGTATENGGALYVDGISQTLSGINIFGGSAVNGGGVYLPEGATLSITGGAQIVDGTATNGGGVYLAGGQLNLINGTSINHTTATNGGCVYMAAGELNVNSGAWISDGSATNGGCVYYAGGNLNLADDQAKIMMGSASTAGGNLYVAADATCTINNGAIISGSAKTGGNVFVPAKATLVLKNGSITMGSATGNGGNVHVAAEGSFTMENGELTDGTSSSNNGGNVYTEGSFTLAGGSISGGDAQYGGNIHVQNETSQFTMTGGTVTGGTGAKNICTSQNGLSNTRLEGGKIVGTVFVQGNLTLAGTTDGIMNITVKVPHERLTIEGKYTGQVNLTLSDGTYDAGSKIGISNGADISKDKITIQGHTDKYVEVVGEELRLGKPEITDISIDASQAKTTYRLGEDLDTTGLVLVATYSNGSTKEFTEGFVVTGFDSNQGGSQTLYVEYEGCTASYTVFVKEQTGIRINTMPNKLIYNLGEDLVIDGLTLKAIYNDETEEDITEDLTEGLTVTGFNPNESGNQELTITYDGFTTTFTVTVKKCVCMVNGVYYNDLDAAMAASSDKYPVVLLLDVEQIVLTKDLYLDLNGKYVDAVETNGNKLYCMDSQTADYDVANEVYGTVPEGVAVAVSGYLAVTEDGKTSYHKYEMEVTELVLNPTDLSINYGSTFRGDQKVQEQVKEFGIAMRAYNAPNETSIWSDPDCKTHIAHTNERWVTGNIADTVKSVGVTDIIDPNVEDAVNKARSEVEIYGRTYILLENGQMLFGEACEFSMQSATEYIDTLFNSVYLSPNNRTKLLDMYKTYHSFMQYWKLTNIQAASGENDISILGK